MDVGMVYYGLGVLPIAALVVWMKRGQGTTGGVTSLSETAAQLAQAAATAQDLVAAAEQLWSTGRLEKNERSEWVMDQLADLFPGLSENQLEAMLEAAVYLLKMTSALPISLNATTELVQESNAKLDMLNAIDNQIRGEHFA